jgi:RNA polymerase sigma-70 factor (ECF subfamily)
VELDVDSSLTDLELIQHILDRQGWAFDLLFERYVEAVSRHISRVVNDQSAAEDLLQETFLRVWTHAGQWSGQGSFKGWLFRIATNLSLNHLRSRRRHPEQPLEAQRDLDEGEEPPDTPAWLVDMASLRPDESVEQSETNARLRQIIQDLPKEKREIFQMVHQMEMSLQDAAGQLGIPEGTAKSRLYYARQHITEQWRVWQAEQE